MKSMSDSILRNRNGCVQTVTKRCTDSACLIARSLNFLITKMTLVSIYVYLLCSPFSSPNENTSSVGLRTRQPCDGTDEKRQPGERTAHRASQQLRLSDRMRGTLIPVSLSLMGRREGSSHMPSKGQDTMEKYLFYALK